MRRRPGRLALACALALVAAAASRPAAAATPGACQDGVLPGGALSRVCVPAAGWTGDLLVWAHGYVAADQPLDFYHLDLGDGLSLPELAQRLGFAFATTSYRTNGLAILPAVDDVLELLDAVPAVAGRAPRRAFVSGASDGAVVTALLIERHPERLAGGVAACGPIGSFRRQVDYVGDFRVLFDYFFPGVIPGSPIDIPPAVMDDWDAVYLPAIEAALAADPVRARELVRVAGAAVAPGDAGSIAATAVDVLWYNVFGANDASAKLGGNPFDNRTRRYRGSSDDGRLNALVARVAAVPAARAALAPYETSGEPGVPLVTLHTTLDPVIPAWHEVRYALKVVPADRRRVVYLTPVAYGHCAFTARDLLGALGALLRTVRASP